MERQCNPQNKLVVPVALVTHRAVCWTHSSLCIGRFPEGFLVDYFSSAVFATEFEVPTLSEILRFGEVLFLRRNTPILAGKIC